MHSTSNSDDLTDSHRAGPAPLAKVGQCGSCTTQD